MNAPVPLPQPVAIGRLADLAGAVDLRVHDNPSLSLLDLDRAA